MVEERHGERHHRQLLWHRCWSGLPWLVVVAAWALALWWGSPSRVDAWRWWAFGAQMLGMAGAIGLLVGRPSRIARTSAGAAALLAVAGLAAVPRLARLATYPFVALGDQLRDGGLDAQRVWLGEITNIFAYGTFESHGRIIPILTSFVYAVLGSTTLTFRLSAALVGIMDVLLVYLVVRRTTDRATGVLSAAVLALLPLHLYYSRTEVVVILSSLWTTLLLLVVSWFWEQPSWRRLGAVAVTCGWTAQFHTSVRTVSLVALVTSLAGYAVFCSRQRGPNRARRAAQAVGFAILLFAGTFGPRWWYSPPNIFFQSRTIAVKQAIERAGASEHLRGPVLEHIAKVPGDYWDSLGILTHKPTMSHFGVRRPLLPALAAMLGAVGIGGVLLLLETSALSRVAAFFLLVIPFTNSVVPEGINMDHRLAPLFPVCAVLAGFGAHLVWCRLRLGPFARGAVLTSLVAALSLHAVRFFVDEEANQGWWLEDYWAQHLVNVIQTHVPASQRPEITVGSSGRGHALLEAPHLQEGFRYLLYPTRTTLVRDDTLPEYVARVSLGRPDEKIYSRVAIDCRWPVPFTCPPRGPGAEFVFFIETP